MLGNREGQTAILTWMKDEFLAEIDSRLGSLGYSDRSKFIRDAVYEKLGLPKTGSVRELPMAPTRKGKGGSPTHYKRRQSHNHSQAKKV